MLVCARLRCMESALWGSKLYLSMKHLEKHEMEIQMEQEGAWGRTAVFGSPGRGNQEHLPSETKCERSLTVLLYLL